MRGGSFLSRDYRGLAAGYSVTDSDYRFTALSHVAQSPSGKGTKLQLNSALPLIKNLKLNAGYSIQSERYRSPTQLRSPRKDDSEGAYWHLPHGASSSHQRQSYSLGLGWHHQYIGNLSLGVTRTEGEMNNRISESTPSGTVNLAQPPLALAWKKSAAATFAITIPDCSPPFHYRWEKTDVIAPI